MFNIPESVFTFTEIGVHVRRNTQNPRSRGDRAHGWSAETPRRGLRVKMRGGWFEMTRSAVAATAVAALLLAGCGHAVRDSVKTSGEAAERAVREWERTQSALVLAEDARNAARDAAAAAAAPPALGDRADFIEDRAEDARDRADDAEDRADDARDRADDARDRAEDLRNRARDAEEGAKKASEWMAGKGFYTSEQYWDCDRYRGHEAFRGPAGSMPACERSACAGRGGALACEPGADGGRACAGAVS